MAGWALMACILIRVHARPREWLTVAELASHLAVDLRTLRAQVLAMHEHAQLAVRFDEHTGLATHVRAMERATGEQAR